MFAFLVLLASIQNLLAVPIVTDKNYIMDPRIVGGNNASICEFPYQISLRDKQSNKHLCGGSILNENWILTAAHCVVGISHTKLTVVVGTNTLTSGGQYHDVKRVAHHENYNSMVIENDIAVIKVSKPIEFNECVQPIQLDEHNIGADEDCLLSGWGSIKFPSSPPDNLQYIKLKTISVEECQRLHKIKPIYESQVCTLTQKGEGACHGDSGGPLVSNGKHIGVVSWGKPCAVGYPDVFTRVYSYLYWIKINTKY